MAMARGERGTARGIPRWMARSPREVPTRKMGMAIPAIPEWITFRTEVASLQPLRQIATATQPRPLRASTRMAILGTPVVERRAAEPEVGEPTLVGAAVHPVAVAAEPNPVGEAAHPVA